MRLSDAIALGRTILEPVAGTFNDHHGGGCAIGMAYEAIGKDFLVSNVREWNWVHTVRGKLPCSCTRTCNCELCVQDPAISCIVHLFDVHVMGKGDWTLDQLIDWVRSVEPPEQVTEVKEEAHETERCDSLR
jgi:hypothetical protein